MFVEWSHWFLHLNSIFKFNFILCRTYLCFILSKKLMPDNLLFAWAKIVSIGLMKEKVLLNMWEAKFKIKLVFQLSTERFYIINVRLHVDFFFWQKFHQIILSIHENFKMIFFQLWFHYWSRILRIVQRPFKTRVSQKRNEIAAGIHQLARWEYHVGAILYLFWARSTLTKCFLTSNNSLCHFSRIVNRRVK